MSELVTNRKVRGINKYAHPAEVGQFLIDNADRVKVGVILLDYEGDDGNIHTHERYFGPWKNSELAWWVACLQSTLNKNMG